jgi:hypothetical protein
VAAIPARVFGTSAPAFRAGPGGHVLWRAPTGTPPATNVATTLGYGTGTGSRQVQPGVANTTAGSAGASATNKGWRDESYSHTNQGTNPTRLTGAWTFRYSLLGGTLNSTFQMTVVVYAITAANVARELFRNTSGNIVVGATEVNFDHTFTPSNVDLVADEILQYEFFLNCSTNGNTVAGTTVIFRAGAAAALLTAPAILGTTIIAVLPRSAVDSAPAVDGVPARLVGRFRGQTESQPTTAALARSLILLRGLLETFPTTGVVDRIYGSFRAITQSIPIGADLVARGLVLVRALTETIATSSTVALSFAGMRGIAETIPTTGALARFFSGGRGASEVTTTAAALDRIYGAIRGAAGSAPAVDTRARALVLARALIETLPTAAAVVRQFTAQRGVNEYPPGVTPDFPLQFPTKSISGIVKDGSGTPVAGATVKLFRQGDDKWIATTVSAADGSYSFVRDLLDTQNRYWVAAYIGGVPQKQGLSDRDLEGA